MTQLQMPKVDTEVLNNKQVYISDLKKILKKKKMFSLTRTRLDHTKLTH